MWRFTGVFFAAVFYPLVLISRVVYALLDKQDLDEVEPAMSVEEINEKLAEDRRE